MKAKIFIQFLCALLFFNLVACNNVEVPNENEFETEPEIEVETGNSEDPGELTEVSINSELQDAFKSFFPYEKGDILAFESTSSDRKLIYTVDACSASYDFLDEVSSETHEMVSSEIMNMNCKLYLESGESLELGGTIYAYSLYLYVYGPSYKLTYQMSYDDLELGFDYDLDNSYIISEAKYNYTGYTSYEYELEQGIGLKRINLAGDDFILVQ